MSISPNEPIGLIGLGLLGSAIAERLIERQYSVLGFDLDSSRCTHASQRGVEIVSEASSVFRQCEWILLSLPTSDIVAQVIAEVNNALRPGQIILDTTTGEPRQMQSLGTELAQQGVSYLDASVAGSSALARRGEVVMLVGGDEEAFHRCSHLLDALSKHAFHAGESGAGSKLKLVHNLILGLHRAVLAEGLCFAEKMGLDSAQVLDILKQTVAHSRVMDLKGEKMVHREFSPQATVTQHLKDVRLMLAEAEQIGSQLPLTHLHRQLLEKVELAGFGDLDNSAIMNAFHQGDE